MADMQGILNKGVADGDLPFVVAMVANRDGIRFSGAAGEAASGRPAAEDTIFRIFSATKAIGSTAAAILVERGKLNPETPVEDILPEFRGIQVLDGYEGDRPIFRAPRTKATIRHLATHTSGIEYEFWNGDVVAYMEKTGHPSLLSGTRASLNYPMMSDPGTRWGYGPSIDWLGLAVQQVDGRSITRFVEEEILEPLGMRDTHFETPQDKAGRVAAVSIRGPDGQFAPIDVSPPAQPEVYGMGHALYGTAPDYIRFLRTYLNGGQLDGKRILSEKTVSWIFEDQMRGLRFRPMISSSPLSADFDPFPDIAVGHSFGFLRNEVDVPGRRSAGSQSWAGVLNSHYWLDPRKDVAAVIFTQSLPFGEARYMKVYEDFEKAAYA